MRLRSFRVLPRSLLPGCCLAALAACGDATAPPKPEVVELVTGDAQTDTVGATLGTALKIRVLDERGRPLVNYAVTWSVTAGDAVVTPAAPVTDVQGGSAASLTLGSVAGDIRVVASIGTSHTTAFTATSAAGRPASATPSVNAIRFAALADTTRIQLLIKDRAGNAIDTARVTWASSDPAVVAVPAAGVAVSLKPGTATVTATVADGPVVQLPATVAQEIAAVGIDAGTRIFTALGDSMQLSARALDRNQFEVAGATLEWSTSDSMVVQVDSTGLIRATGPGTANVTVRSASASSNAAFSVIQDAAELTIDPDSITINAFADTALATGTARDRNGYVIEGATIQWSVSDTAIASVDANGVVTSRANGTTQLQASFDGVTERALVRVHQTAAEVVVTPEENTLHALADTAQFAAMAYDANEHEIVSAVFTWSSADTSIAVVDTAGRAISRAPGETAITASLDGATGEALIMIEQVPASVAVNPESLTLSALEDTAQLTAIAYDSSGFEIADATFSWSAENSSIAAVNSNGLVTGQTPGITVVSALSGEAEGESTVTVRQTPARVSLAPADLTITAVDDTAHLRATAFDANGNVIDDAAFIWSVADTAVATVDAQGVVKSRRGGQTTVTVRSGQAEDDGIVRVVQRAEAVTLEPPGDSLRSETHRIQLVATARDRNGFEVTGRTFTWRSLRTAAVRVSDSGVLSAAGTRGDARVIATMDGEADTVVVTHMPYGVLVLTFDDAFADVYTRVLPLLKLHGIRANIALPTGWVGKTGHLTLSQVKEIHAAGWSIVPHGVTHLDLTGMTRQAMEKEIADSKEWVQDQGFRGSAVFIVPLHRWGDREKTEIRKRFKAARGYGNTHPSHGGMVDWPAADPYALTAIPADDYFTTEDGRAQMEAWWIEAITTGKFVGTYFHDISAANYASFEKAIQRLAKYKDRLHTHSELFE